MTATTAYPRSNTRGFGTRHLILTGLLGAAIGVGGTLILARPDQTAPPAGALSSQAAASTSAGQQYMDWYTRPNVDAPATAAPKVATYPDAGGSTTAGGQYLDWYTRPAMDGNGWTSTSDYYRSWFLRDAGDR